MIRKTSRSGERSLVAYDRDDFPDVTSREEIAQFNRDIYWLENGFDQIDALDFSMFPATLEQ